MLFIKLKVKSSSVIRTCRHVAINSWTTHSFMLSGGLLVGRPTSRLQVEVRYKTSQWRSFVMLPQEAVHIARSWQSYTFSPMSHTCNLGFMHCICVHKDSILVCRLSKSIIRPFRNQSHPTWKGNSTFKSWTVDTGLFFPLFKCISLDIWFEFFKCPQYKRNSCPLAPFFRSCAPLTERKCLLRWKNNNKDMLLLFHTQSRGFATSNEWQGGFFSIWSISSVSRLVSVLAASTDEYLL